MATRPRAAQPQKSPVFGAPGAIRVCVRDGLNPFRSGLVSLYRANHLENCCDFNPGQWEQIREKCDFVADNDGVLEKGCHVFSSPDVTADVYVVWFEHAVDEPVQCVEVHPGCTAEVCFDIGANAKVLMSVIDDQCRPMPCAPIRVGDLVEAEISGLRSNCNWDYIQPAGWTKTGAFKAQTRVKAAGSLPGVARVAIPSTRVGQPAAQFALDQGIDSEEREPVPVTGSLTVSHRRRIAEPDGSLSFFVRLLDFSKAVGFGSYRDFIDRVFGCKPSAAFVQRRDTCLDKFAGPDSKLQRLKDELTDHGVGAYELLKTATEAFLLVRCCIRPCRRGDAPENPNAPILSGWPLDYSENPDLGDYRRHASTEWQKLFCDYLGSTGLRFIPYIQRVIDTAFPGYEVPDDEAQKRFCTDVLLRSRVDNPCFMELIWNYWHEEGMLVQSINAVSRRFQNQRAPGERDPLAHMEIDPLRPLNNILWGYVEDERNRLSIRRRAHEYQHHYGLNLYGKAVADIRPADNRSKFIEAFHNLLNKCADYYRAKQDTTVDPDGYPILHAIQELNLILAQNAHNQFGDLPWTSRVEMLMQEWIMARPEMRDFLQSRAMVPYKEEWMPQVDTMKTLQGWSNVVVTHFRDLGVFGEQILLTIRWYNWYDVTSEEEAKGWADLLRAQIQGYIHAYRAVTGVDLSNMDSVDYTMPSVHLRKRLAMQQRAL